MVFNKEYLKRVSSLNINGNTIQHSTNLYNVKQSIRYRDKLFFVIAISDAGSF